MKNQILFLFLFISTGIQAQKMIHELPAKTNVDSTNWLFLTGNPTSGKLYKITAANLRDSVYPATDTTSLSNRINLKLNATDTASLSTRIDLKLNATDTASLSTRIDAISGSPNVYYTSLEGAVSDATITPGSASYGTDNTATLQAILNHASDGTPIVVYWDGRYSVSATLRIYSNTKIIGTSRDMGVIARVNMNANIFQNYNFSDDTVHTDQNISIENLTINGNGGQQSLLQTEANGFIVPVRFTGADHVSIIGCNLINSRSFAAWIMNCNYWQFKDCYSNYYEEYSPVQVHLHDGLHINGPSKFGVVENCQFVTDDDAVMFAADDVFQPTWPGTNFHDIAYDHDPIASYGDITDMDVNNVTLLPGSNGGATRILTTISKAKRISISNIKGETRSHVFLCDNWYGGSPANPGDGWVEDVVLRNINVEILTGSDIYLTYYALGGRIKNITFRDIVRRNFVASNYPTFKIQPNAAIDNLIIDNYQQIGGVNDLPVFLANDTIKNLKIINSSISGVGSTVLNIPFVKLNTSTGGQIDNLQLDNIITDSVNNIVDFSHGQIGNIQASNIIHKNATTGQGAILVNTGKTLGDLTILGYHGNTVPVSGAGTLTRSNVATSGNNSLITSSINATSTVGVMQVEGVDNYGQTMVLQSPVSSYTGGIFTTYKANGALGSGMLAGVNFTADDPVSFSIKNRISTALLTITESNGNLTALGSITGTTINGTTFNGTGLQLVTTAVDMSSTTGIMRVQGVDQYGQTMVLQAPTASYTGGIFTTYKANGGSGAGMLAGVNFTADDPTSFSIKSRTGTDLFRVKESNGLINLSGVPTYADDTAAGAGGLVAGDIFKTAAGDLKIKL